MSANLLDWLRAHTGLDADLLGPGAVARVADERARAAGCGADGYVALLERSAEERQAFIDRIVVAETWFFRDRPALDGLARQVVDSWGPAHPGAVFRILSAPCATGEEPYSIAMAMALAGWPLERLRIDAVDLSHACIRGAEKRVYRPGSFRGGDLQFRDVFFTAVPPGGWRVADALRECVHFSLGNILGPEFVGRAPYDAVFCRNLLIYFDRATQREAIGVLDRLLAPGAWLAVGPAEPVLFFDHGFAALEVPGGFLLHKPPAPVVMRTAARAPVPAPVPRPLATRKTAPRRPARPSAAPAPRAPDAAPSESLDQIRALADAGRLTDAAERGEMLLRRMPPSADLLCLLGVIADAMGHPAKAEGLYRKAAYLEPRHAEALSHLALLTAKAGHQGAAQQLQNRVRRLNTLTS